MQGQKNCVLGEVVALTYELELLAVGQQAGLWGDVLERYVNFMYLRFPGGRAYMYLEEWAERFATGHPETYCDPKSLQVLKNLQYLFISITKKGVI